MTQQAQPNLKSLPYGGASCIINPDFTNEIHELIIEAAKHHCLEDKDIQNKFLVSYKDWILKTKNNNIYGLEHYPVMAFSSGTTEGFDKFMIKNHNRRFRCLRGEYMYHTASWKKFLKWAFIEDEPLHENDAVVMSVPFSDTGNVHPYSAKIIQECNTLKIPVLIDSAFFGICGNVYFDYNQPCITDITFSLSKSFPVANLRIGMRLSKVDDDDGLLIHTKINYNNRLSAAVGYSLLQKYNADYNFDTYRYRQLKFCDMLGIDASDSVIFGTHSEKFKEYNRGGPSNRLCFSKYLLTGNLPNS